VVQIEIADEGTITPSFHPYEHMTCWPRAVRVSCTGDDPVEYRAPAAITIRAW